MVKIGLYLMNKKGLEVLLSIINNKLDNYVKFVVGAKDKNVVNDYYLEIRGLCNKYNIVFFDRSEKKRLPFADYRIAIGWRWLIEDSKNLIILHDSLLPKYRGFSPLVNSLINGEKKIGVTALFADEEYDRGDIIKQEFVEITYPIKINNAINIISTLYSKITCEIIEGLQTSKLKTFKQDEEEASYSLWRDSDDYFINWNWDSSFIERFVNSLGFPYNGAKTRVKQELIIISEVEKIKDVVIEIRQPGKVIFFKDSKPVIVCGKGLIKINKMTTLSGENYILKSFRTKFY